MPSDKDENDQNRSPSASKGEKLTSKKPLPGKTNIDPSNSLPIQKQQSSPRGQKSFQKRIVDLKSYKEMHWHLFTKQSHDVSLYRFCRSIVAPRKNIGKPDSVKLNAERIASLDAIGFNWEVNGKPQFTHKPFTDLSKDNLQNLRPFAATRDARDKRSLAGKYPTATAGISQHAPMLCINHAQRRGLCCRHGGRWRPLFCIRDG